MVIEYIDFITCQPPLITSTTIIILIIIIDCHFHHYHHFHHHHHCHYPSPITTPSWLPPRVQVLETLSGTTSGLIQELCAKCICNLTCAEDCHKVLIDNQALQVIIMIALLRAVAPATKLLCAKVSFHPTAKTHSPNPPNPSLTSPTPTSSSLLHP